MTGSGRKSLVLQGIHHFGGGSKKLLKHWSSPPCHRGSSGNLSVLGEKQFMRKSQDSFDYVVGHRTIHSGYSLNNSFGSRKGWKNEGSFSVNPKETMNVLNDRLANYLRQVSELEEQNNRLERKIQEWNVKSAPKELPNLNDYWRTAEDLQKEIFSANVKNAEIILQIDNARLAGDDLLNKYNLESSISKNIEVDIQALRKGLEGLNLDKEGFQFRLNSLTEEMQSLKKNHHEDVNTLKSQLGARLNVEVDAAPSVDLNKTLLEIRKEYESLMAQNTKDVETWFMTQSEELNRQMISGTQYLQTVQSEIIELRYTIQTLEIDLQTELNKKLALEGTLAETENDYMTHLAYNQDLIKSMEADLAGLRCDLERQHNEYKILMDVRSRLEMEIATYQRLLQEEEIVPRVEASKQKGARRLLKVVSITEDYKDGKVVSKHEHIRHL